MSVTANDYLPGATINIRNVEEGVTDSDSSADRKISTRNAEAARQRRPWRKSWSTDHLAEVEGGICGACGRDLADDEPVFIGRRPRRYREPDHRCRDCAPKWLRDIEPGVRYEYPWREESGIPADVYCNLPCDECSRPVIFRTTGGRYRLSRRVFCSRQCSSAYYNQLRNERNARAREKVCESCGEAFTATRRDARTCSAACRQRAYRKRQHESSGKHTRHERD
jgi:hypothetical protein